MSEDKDIVTEPLPKKERIKDPKKVAAGLKLAAANKEARAALAREKAREASAREASAREASEPESADSSEQVHANTLSSLSWQHLIGLGGLIIGAGGLYLQWKRTTPKPIVTDMPSRIEPRIEKHNTPPMV